MLIGVSVFIFFNKDTEYNNVVVPIPSIVETTTTTVKETTTTTEYIPPTTTIQYVPPTTVYVAPTTTQQQTANDIGSFLACVRGHESDTAGGYSAVNPSSGAGGAYQFLQQTWDNTAANLGRTDLIGVHPSQAAPADQDMMATHLYNWQGASPWAGSGC